MTFRFPYKHILNLKEKEKEQAFSEFGRLQQERETIVEELEAIIEERNERQNSMNVAISAAILQQQDKYVGLLNQRIEMITEKLIRLEEEIRVSQANLMEKQQDEKMWNHLREKSFEDYKLKENKAEQDRLDEIATVRHYQQTASI